MVYRHRSVALLELSQADWQRLISDPAFLNMVYPADDTSTTSSGPPAPLPIANFAHSDGDDPQPYTTPMQDTPLPATSSPRVPRDAMPIPPAGQEINCVTCGAKISGLQDCPTCTQTRRATSSGSRAPSPIHAPERTSQDGRLLQVDMGGKNTKTLPATEGVIAFYE